MRLVECKECSQVGWLMDMELVDGATWFKVYQCRAKHRTMVCVLCGGDKLNCKHVQ